MVGTLYLAGVIKPTKIIAYITISTISKKNVTTSLDERNNTFIIDLKTLEITYMTNPIETTNGLICESLFCLYANQNIHAIVNTEKRVRIPTKDWRNSIVGPIAVRNEKVPM
jgi:hypothetical protein